MGQTCSSLARIKVIQTTSNLADFVSAGGSGAEILSSSIHGLNQVTICVRFVTYQFTNYKQRNERAVNPLQLLIWSKDAILLGSYTMDDAPSTLLDYMKDLIGNKWQKGNAVGYQNINNIDVFPIWKIGKDSWNHACIIMNIKENYFATHMNGKRVHLKKDISNINFRDINSNCKKYHCRISFNFA